MFTCPSLSPLSSDATCSQLRGSTYHQVVQGIEAAVHAGLLEPGSRLENEIDLAAQLNLSRPTMRKAMDDMGPER